MIAVVSCTLWLVFTPAVAMTIFVLLKQKPPMPVLTVVAAGAINSAWLGALCYRKGRSDGRKTKA